MTELLYGLRLTSSRKTLFWEHILAILQTCSGPNMSPISFCPGRAISRKSKQMRELGVLWGKTARRASSVHVAFFPSQARMRRTFEHIGGCDRRPLQMSDRSFHLLTIKKDKETNATPTEKYRLCRRVFFKNVSRKRRKKVTIGAPSA